MFGQYAIDGLAEFLIGDVGGQVINFPVFVLNFEGI